MALSRKDGFAGPLQVIQSAEDELDAAVVTEVSNGTNKPATRNGDLVRCIVDVEMSFKM